MSDSDPAERQADAGTHAVESTAEWSQFLDRLINWAVGQGDAAVDQLHTYFLQRTEAGPEPHSDDSVAESAGGTGYRRQPGSVGGRDRSGPSLRHRPTGCISRPLGARRSPRQRRMPG